MISYLQDDDALTELIQGRPVEQWLGATEHGAYRSLKWLRIDPDRNLAWIVSLFEVFDDGRPDFLDIYEFEAVDPDHAYGECETFGSPHDALDFAVSKLGAVRGRFVRGGDIQIEYSAYLVSSRAQ